MPKEFYPLCLNNKIDMMLLQTEINYYLVVILIEMYSFKRTWYKKTSRV